MSRSATSVRLLDRRPARDFQFCWTTARASRQSLMPPTGMSCARHRCIVGEDPLVPSHPVLYDEDPRVRYSPHGRTAGEDPLVRCNRILFGEDPRVRSRAGGPHRRSERHPDVPILGTDDSPSSSAPINHSRVGRYPDSSSSAFVAAHAGRLLLRESGPAARRSRSDRDPITRCVTSRRWTLGELTIEVSEHDARKNADAADGGSAGRGASDADRNEHNAEGIEPAHALSFADRQWSSFRIRPTIVEVTRSPRPPVRNRLPPVAPMCRSGLPARSLWR